MENIHNYCTMKNSPESNVVDDTIRNVLDKKGLIGNIIKTLTPYIE
jgi:hypothetical protein